MLISFFNPSDLIGCGGDINQSDSFRYAEGVCGGVSLQLIRLCGEVSLQLFRLCGGVSLQLGCLEGCHSN